MASVSYFASNKFLYIRFRWLRIILRLKRRLVCRPIKNVDGCPCYLKFGHVKLGQGEWLFLITQPNAHAWRGRLSNAGDTLASPNHVNK
ncbi:hypothetical protein WN943_011809 [Citrus x changshan-huyou]